MRVAFVNAPDHLDDLLGPLPEGLTPLARLGKDLDFVHPLRRIQPACKGASSRASGALARSGMLWISRPKKTAPQFADLTGTTWLL